MTKQLYDLKSMQKAVEEIKPRSAASVIRCLLPLIEQKRREGISLQQIYEALVATGLKTSKSNFTNTVVRLTKEAKLERLTRQDAGEGE